MWVVSYCRIAYCLSPIHMYLLLSLSLCLYHHERQRKNNLYVSYIIEYAFTIAIYTFWPSSQSCRYLYRYLYRIFESFSLPRKTFHSFCPSYFWPFSFNYLIFSFSIHLSFCLSLVSMLLSLLFIFSQIFFPLNVNLCQPFHWPINWYQICYEILWYIYIDYLVASILLFTLPLVSHSSSQYLRGWKWIESFKSTMNLSTAISFRNVSAKCVHLWRANTQKKLRK